jgi:tetratricopeptide (TPR) repeat protein
MLLGLGSLSSPAQPAHAGNQARDAAFALEQEGQIGEAEEAWQAILKAHPANAEADAHLGFLEARQEHFTQAISYYRRAMAIEPSMPELRLNLGLALFKSGALKEAIATFTPLLKDQQPSSPDALRLETLIGVAHFGLGEYGAAVPYLRLITANDPKNLPYRLLLAQSCLWSKQYACVLDVYHQILLLNAESAEADMLAGEALDEMNDPGGATEQFRLAVKADPHEPNVHFGLGYLLWSQNHFDEAAKEFQAELANVPDQPQALAYLADCEIHLDQAADIRPLLEKALRTDSGIERAHLDLGILDAQSGNQEDAVREFKLAERLSPADSDVHWRLARLYQSMGDKANAKIEFDKTSSLHKAENDKLLMKMRAAQERGKATAPPLDPAANE